MAASIIPWNELDGKIKKKMEELKGFDSNGCAILKKRPTHNISDLPMKGFAKNMDGVGVNEPVIIPASFMSPADDTIRRFTLAEIGHRAAQLEAEVMWMELPTKIDEQRKFQIWFSPTKNQQ